jgi:formylglycine-generating enzyme required for sulfatase activity
MAFCAWLSAQWSEADPTTPGWVIRLPSEAEWQRAAEGNTGCAYPWGDSLAPGRANYGKHIGQPTPVTRYIEGETPCGALDMCGNVWEWCLTAWGIFGNDISGYTYRVMRGGAWNVSNPEYLQSHARYGHPPRGQLNDAGFRIACARRI